MKAKGLFFLVCVATILSAFSASAGTFTIPDGVMKSCVFVMVGDKPVGTGFLIGVKDPDSDSTFCYFVTARHVIQPAIQNSATLNLRLNKKDTEGAEVLECPIIAFDGRLWIEDSNPAIDLAVAVLAIWDKVGKYDVNLLTVDSATNDLFATRSFIERFKIRPGDRAFTLGLVPYLFSKECENIIMTRSGTISMIGTKDLALPGGKQKAHFLDSASFAGQSGSPAFVLLERTEDNALIAGWRIALLGVVTEFVPSPLRFGEAKVAENAEQEKQNTIIPIENTGISKVVPVDYLVDLLFSNKQQEFRRSVWEVQKKSSDKPPKVPQ